MKTSTKLLVLLFILPLLSCHRNRLKTDEKQLAKDLIEQDSEKLTLEMKASGTNDRLSASFRKKEIRTLDKEHPPIKIDILETPFSTKELKLSDVAATIRYVKLQRPPDTTLLFDPVYDRPDINSYIRSDGEQIIFQGLFGLTRFSMQGEYRETIWKNKTGIRIYGKGAIYGGQDLFGVLPYVPVSLSDGYLYANFMDGPEKSGQVMRHKLNPNMPVSVNDKSEIPGLDRFPGDTVLYSKYKNGLREVFDQIYGIGPGVWAGMNSKWNAGTTGILLVTFNTHGDTLCKFTDYDRIVNFTQSVARKAIEPASYSFNGLLTIKQEYNDTVFRLKPPDRLVPVYIIKIGEPEFTFMEGLNADFDLSGKYMLKSLHETNDFLFIRYTQNYDSPNTRKKNAVTFYNAIFDKKENKLYHQPGSALLPEGLANDLDGGISFWPDFITPQGEMMKLLSGQVLKDYVHSERFKNAPMSEEDREKQISMSAGLKPTDMVVIIAK